MRFGVISSLFVVILNLILNSMGIVWFFEVRMNGSTYASPAKKSPNDVSISLRILSRNQMLSLDCFWMNPMFGTNSMYFLVSLGWVISIFRDS